MNRNKILSDLAAGKDRTWDIVIIGGGATGLGTALDAASRGFSTLLLEQYDFSKGTSSRSTKLVHGGVRYLAQGDIFLVMEALHERGIMMKNAPHLTVNQEFVIPVYSLFDAVKYTAGLKLYDLLAGKLSLGKSYFIRGEEVLSRLPGLRRKGLKGGVVYHDGQFDDSRFAIALASKCIERGGSLLNYCRVEAFQKNEKGRITGVEAVDGISGQRLVFKAKLVINATGVFADGIARLDDPAAEPAIRPSQGVHIVTCNMFPGSSSALMIPETADGRVLFAIPWHGRLVLGTTDTPVDNVSPEPTALKEEIGFILKTASAYLDKPVKKEDILSIFAGLRPLAADPHKSGATREISRRHKITVSPSGLLSVIGGKWTTYRRMAEETLDIAARKGLLDKRKCITGNLRLSDLADHPAGDPLAVYGPGAQEIMAMMSSDPEMAERIHPRLSYTVAEIIWICRNEMACTVEDVLARRTRALFLDAAASREVAPAVSAIMAKELGYGTDWQDEQISAYNRLVINYMAS